MIKLKRCPYVSLCASSVESILVEQNTLNRNLPKSMSEAISVMVFAHPRTSKQK